MSLLAFAIKYIMDLPLFYGIPKRFRQQLFPTVIHHTEQYWKDSAIISASFRGDRLFSLYVFFVIPVLKCHSVPVNCFSVFSQRFYNAAKPLHIPKPHRYDIFVRFPSVSESEVT